MKRCTKCGVKKSFGCFSKNLRGKYGLCSECKICRNVMFKTYRENNICKEKARNAEFRSNNSEYISKLRKKNYQNSREFRIQYSRDWRKSNPEKAKSVWKNWYSVNRESVIERQKLAYGRRKAAINGAATGLIPVEILESKWFYYGNSCWVCGKDATATDHVKPLAKGGPHMLANLRPICKPCNSSKRDTWPIEDWLENRRSVVRFADQRAETT